MPIQHGDLALESVDRRDLSDWLISFSEIEPNKRKQKSVKMNSTFSLYGEFLPLTATGHTELSGCQFLVLAMCSMINYTERWS